VTTNGDSVELDSLYAARFDAADEAWKRVVWGVLWQSVFSRLIPADGTLVDLGGGYCELANAAVARRRIVVDMNPATPRYASPGVEVHLGPVHELGFLADGSVDVVFTSNLLEHLPTKALLSETIREARRVLRPGGRLLAVGPNIRFMPNTYWDYIDHHLPLSDRSVAELFRASGLEVERVEPRFLPATVKSRLPRWAILVHLYLALRPLSSLLLGKQFLVVARKPDSHEGR